MYVSSCARRVRTSASASQPKKQEKRDEKQKREKPREKEKEKKTEAKSDTARAEPRAAGRGAADARRGRGDAQQGAPATHRKAQQQARLADARVADEQQLEQVVAAHARVSLGGRPVACAAEQCGRLSASPRAGRRAARGAARRGQKRKINVLLWIHVCVGAGARRWW